MPCASDAVNSEVAVQFSIGEIASVSANEAHHSIVRSALAGQSRYSSEQPTAFGLHAMKNIW